MADIDSPAIPAAPYAAQRFASGPITMAGQQGPMPLNTASMGGKSVTVPRVGSTGGWNAPPAQSANGMTYDPEAGGMVPQGSSISGMVGHAIASGARGLVQSAAGLADPSYAPPAENVQPVVGPSATQPRTGAPVSYAGNEGRGLPGVTPGVQGGYTPQLPADPNLPAGVTHSGNSYSGNFSPTAQPQDGMTDAQRNNAPFHQAYLNMEAQNKVDAAQGAQARQTAIQQSGLNANAAQSGLDLDKANRNAEIADFLSKNGSDMILSGGSKTQKQAIIASAARADREREQAQATATGARIAAAKGNPQDFLEQAARGQGIVSSAAKTGTEQAQGQQNLEKGQLDIRHAQMVNGLASQLGTEKDPTRLGQLQNSLLTLMGKDPADYTVAHAAGETYFDPSNPTVPLKRPDTIAIVNKRTGAQQIVPIGGTGSQAAAAPQGAQLVQGKPGTPYAGKQGHIVNGQFVPVQ